MHSPYKSVAGADVSIGGPMYRGDLVAAWLLAGTNAAAEDVPKKRSALEKSFMVVCIVQYGKGRLPAVITFACMMKW